VLHLTELLKFVSINYILEIIVFLKDCDFAGFNSNKYDVPLLVEEFFRCDKEFNMTGRRLVDIQNIFHKKEERTLSAAYRFYCDKTLENAHSAEADTIATYEILMAQLDRYDDLEGNVEFLHTYSQRHPHLDFMGRITANKDGLALFNFGKYKGQPVVDVLKKDPAYYGWMMRGDFPAYTKKILTELKSTI